MRKMCFIWCPISNWKHGLTLILDKISGQFQLLYVKNTEIFHISQKKALKLSCHILSPVI